VTVQKDQEEEVTVQKDQEEEVTVQKDQEEDLNYKNINIKKTLIISS